MSRLGTSPQQLESGPVVYLFHSLPFLNKQHPPSHKQLFRVCLVFFLHFSFFFAFRLCPLSPPLFFISSSKIQPSSCQQVCADRDKQLQCEMVWNPGWGRKKNENRGQQGASVRKGVCVNGKSARPIWIEQKKKKRWQLWRRTWEWDGARWTETACPLEGGGETVVQYTV